jgi:hypothetical protein
MRAMDLSFTNNINRGSWKAKKQVSIRRYIIRIARIY